MNDCIIKGFFIFNNECHLSCPENTFTDDLNNSLCICQNYFYYSQETNVYECFPHDKICITANQEYHYTNIETKECFKTKEDCEVKSNINKCKYFGTCEPSKDYMFNNICYSLSNLNLC